MYKKDVVKKILLDRAYFPKDRAKHFAPVNIALVKYWGKRDSELNLPVTSSLSLALPLGTETEITTAEEDAIWLNDKCVPLDTPFATRLIDFLNLFRPKGLSLHVRTKNHVPTGSGLASSASGFAACTLALHNLFGWNLEKKELSILARLGSGSASRSLFPGFVQWHKGVQPDGMDSFAEPLQTKWDELQIGLWILSSKTKTIDSRKAMAETIQSSRLYQSWPDQVSSDLSTIKEAIYTQNFALLGKTAEHNALCMHATMLSANPTICYFLPESLQAMQLIWQLRKEGLDLYFTMDAGPNLKVLFLQKDRQAVQKALPALQLC